MYLAAILVRSSETFVSTLSDNSVLKKTPLYMCHGRSLLMAPRSIVPLPGSYEAPCSEKFRSSMFPGIIRLSNLDCGSRITREASSRNTVLCNP